MSKKEIKEQAKEQKAAIKREQSQTCLNYAEREQARPKVKKLAILLRTMVNGYMLEVNNEGYMYFNAQSLLEGFMVHVGLERLESMTKEETTYNREVPPLAKYAKAHADWKCLLITYDEEGTEGGIPVVPVWKWLMN